MRQRIRVLYARTGDLRFLSQLDVVRTVERSVRRSGLKVAFTEGFHPRVRLSLSPALPTGVEAERAWFDFLLEEAIPPGEIRSRLEGALPEGFALLDLLTGEVGPCAREPARFLVRRADASGAPLLDPGTVDRFRGDGLAGVAGLLGLEWMPDGILMNFSPGSGGARLREALAALGLSGPDSPSLVVRALSGDSPLVLEPAPRNVGRERAR